MPPYNYSIIWEIQLLQLICGALSGACHHLCTIVLLGWTDDVLCYCLEKGVLPTSLHYSIRL
jgi:hypothetical protein